MTTERHGRNESVAAWLLYALQLAGEAMLVPFWLMSVMMTDGCGSVPDPTSVCNSTYFFTWFFAFAALLAVAVVATPIAIVVAGRRGARRWPWPLGAIVLLAIAAAGYMFVMTR